MLREEIAGDNLESMSFASTTTTEILAATNDCNQDKICLPEDGEDTLPLGSQKRPIWKECVVLGQKTLLEVWADMSKITLPS